MARVIFGAVLSSAILSACSTGPRFDPKKFDGVHRAGQAVNSATTVGLTITRYQELVQAFATEIALANDGAVLDREKSLVAEYTAALQPYRDALALWQARVEDKTASNAGAATGFVMATPMLRKFADTYAIEVVPGLSRDEFDKAVVARMEFDLAAYKKGVRDARFPGPPLSREDLINADLGLQAVWKVASTRLEQANRHLIGNGQ